MPRSGDEYELLAASLQLRQERNGKSQSAMSACFSAAVLRPAESDRTRSPSPRWLKRVLRPFYTLRFAYRDEEEPQAKKQYC